LRQSALALAEARRLLLVCPRHRAHD